MTTPLYDIVGLGAALVDILMPIDEAFLNAHELTKSHMHLIDADRAGTLQDVIEDAELVSGGSIANTCLGFSSFGGRAAFMGSVGRDRLGEFFAEDMTREGVTFTNLASQRGTLTTGRCFSFISPDGERTMCTYLGASREFGPRAVRADMVTQARLLFVEGYIWDTEERVAAADAAIRAMKAAGGKVALAVSDGWCAEKYREIFLNYCREGLVDILFANEDEIQSLVNVDTFDAAIKQSVALAPICVHTRSDKGALILAGDQQVKVDVVPIEKLVDATGAGDLFAAGFLYGHLYGATLEQAGRLGAMAASEVISHIGARPKIKLASLCDKIGFKAAA